MLRQYSDRLDISIRSDHDASLRSETTLPQCVLSPSSPPLPLLLFPSPSLLNFRRIVHFWHRITRVRKMQKTCFNTLSRRFRLQDFSTGKYLSIAFLFSSFLLSEKLLVQLLVLVLCLYTADGVHS